MNAFAERASHGRIVVLGTGGTISARAGTHDAVTYRAGELGVDELLARAGVAGLAVESRQVAQIDSKDMTSHVWRLLAQGCVEALSQPDVTGVVVTHGTDTLEETAWLLDQVLPHGRPVVLTGAMRPLGAGVSDGAQNLADALTVAADAQARGVLVAFAGQIHSAQRVQKAHPYRLDALGGGEAGPVGVVEEGRVRWFTPPSTQAAGDAAARARRLQAVLAATSWPRVELVFNHADADGALARLLPAVGVAGVVAAGTGNGTLSTRLEQALREVAAQGVVVWRASRCAEGEIVATGHDELPQAPVSNPVKARISLMLSLLADKMGG